jgi:hypothetical protein
VRCIFVSFFSHYRYCLRMLRLMPSLVKGAAANPKTITYVRIMRSRHVTTPEALMIAVKATVRSDYGPIRMAPSSTPREHVGAISNGHAVRTDGSLAGFLFLRQSNRNTATAVFRFGM